MQYEFFEGGRHSGLMAGLLCDQKVNEFIERIEYEEQKTQLFALAPKVADRIIGIIEKRLTSIGARIDLVKKAIHAISAGEDLSKVERIEEIELASLKVTFGLFAKKGDDLSCAFRKECNKSGLEQYSTSQLKAELRRRKGK